MHSASHQLLSEKMQPGWQSNVRDRPHPQGYSNLLSCASTQSNLQPRIASVHGLSRIPLLNSDARILSLHCELLAYLVAVAQIQKCKNRLSCWSEQNHLPNWQKGACTTFSLVPSSAAAECMISLLQVATSASQGSMLDDNLEDILAIKFNRGRRALQ